LITLEAEEVGLPAFHDAIGFPNPDFAALAKACGARGFRAAKPDELHDAVSEAFAVDGPAIIDASSHPTGCRTFRISNWKRSDVLRWPR
jgi:thiamine pyrophosphate-dependent acetolactate synthase large subunit-like protein